MTETTPRKGPRPTALQAAVLLWISEQPHGQGRIGGMPSGRTTWRPIDICQRMVARGWLREFPGVADAFILTNAGRAALEQE